MLAEMLNQLKTALIATLVLAVLACGIYPLAVWGIAQGLFREQAGGGLIVQKEHVVGSRLIAQGFSAPGYFHPRPSAAGKGYDALSSGGSNLGPLARTLIEQTSARVQAYRRENRLPATALVPADAVLSSGSGLDPHISPANARCQAPRVAAARGVEPAVLARLIAQHTAGRELAFLGEERVNVLTLNLALDELWGRGNAGR